jgi:GNAT superfamily N-acetyltransferase
MELIRYTFDTGLTEKFGDLCDSLYKQDSYWRPATRQHLLSQFAQDYDFYQYPGNLHCHFLALDEGKPVGHISVMVNADLQARYGIHLGIIGFFECMEDKAIAANLLNAARQWFHAQHGITCIIGPMNFDIWRGYRFMTTGFYKPHFFGEPHNKEYYPRFFEQNGFSVCKRWTSILIEGQKHLRRVIDPWLQCYRDALSDGYCFMPLATENTAQIQQVKLVIEDSFSRFLYFNTLSLPEFNKVFGAYIESLDAQLVTLIWNKAGSLVGFAIAFPGDGPEAPDILYMLGITGKEAARRRGVGRAAFYHCLHQLIDAGCTKVLVALAAEDSPVLPLLGDYANCVDKEYVLYQAHL